MENKTLCPVCLDHKKLSQLPCGHQIHRKCMIKWQKVKPICPICLEKVEKIKLNKLEKTKLFFRKCYLNYTWFSMVMMDGERGERRFNYMVRNGRI